MSKVIGAGFDFSASVSYFPLDQTGLAVMSGAGAGGFGSWVEFAADIGTEDIYLESILATLAAVQISRFQVGIGAGGSEVVITNTVANTVVNDQISRKHDLGKVKVAAGSRLAIRCTDNFAGARNYTTFISYSTR